MFNGFAFEEYTLNISLATTDGYDEIVAFDSDGKQFASTSVTPSAGQVSLDFTDYSPGEYRFAAVNSDDDTVVSEVTEVLEPNIELVDWQTASETDMYTSENSIALTDIVMTVENTGNAPSKLTWVGYESEEFTPEWAEEGTPEPVKLNQTGTPKSKEETAFDYQAEFNSDRELPVAVHVGEKLQLVDVNNRQLLTSGMDNDRSVVSSEETKGWSVQQGVEYEFTVMIGRQYAERDSMTKTVTWENMGTSEIMTNQPEDSLIRTSKTEGSN
ncbi:hypothetical protein C435_11425 [Haloarcula marismortui ATCC 33799]|uniref:Uncharacterized protein n=1 Tax=Haloarcula marismortui ATCC 33799 TaxID=662475 RepID=M0K916_9EURY|nr:hypothetical protein C435_11425 [Haloarcula californiae ATCC 33799]